MNEKLTKLKLAVNGSESIHQTILDLAYAEWQSQENPNVNSYKTMIDWAENELGPIASLAILIGKYHQQVCNGGHQQYFDNGYADGIGGVFSHHDSYPLHKRLIKLVEQYLDITCKNELLEILDAFDLETATCEECGGDGEVWCEGEYDEETDEQIEEDYYEECWNCNGTGEDTAYFSVINSDKLDYEYYALKNIEEEYENFFKSILS